MDIFPRKITLRQFLVAAPLAGLGYMRFGEPAWLGVGRHSATLRGGGARPPLTVLHLSDFHASDVVSLDFIDRAVRFALASCKPDLVCLTGDFVTWTWEDWAGFSRSLARLSAVAPTYAVVGNHDGGDWAGRSKGYTDHLLVDDMLAAANVTLLHNTATVFTGKGWRLNVVGVGDKWADELDGDAAFARIDRAQPTLLLSHNPDSKDDVAQFDWDLMLCGHTHGGQLWVPYVGAPFAPVRDPRYVAGMNAWKDRWIHTTKGIGNLHGMRLNCRPEVSVLTLS